MAQKLRKHREPPLAAGPPRRARAIPSASPGGGGGEVSGWRGAKRGTAAPLNFYGPSVGTGEQLVLDDAGVAPRPCLPVLCPPCSREGQPTSWGSDALTRIGRWLAAREGEQGQPASGRAATLPACAEPRLLAREDPPSSCSSAVPLLLSPGPAWPHPAATLAGDGAAVRSAASPLPAAALPRRCAVAALGLPLQTIRMSPDRPREAGERARPAVGLAAGGGSRALKAT